MARRHARVPLFVAVVFCFGVLAPVLGVPAAGDTSTAMPSSGTAQSGATAAQGATAVPSAAAIEAADNPQDVAKFFPQINGDLSKVTWAHAVNSKDLLDQALNDTSIMMFEADVIMGTTPGQTTEVPILGHPPNKTGDLTLETFLRAVILNNNDANDTSRSVKRRGVKLDFKSIEVFEKSLDFLQSNFNATPNFPVWLNADILPGPVNATEALPVDAKRFLDKAKKTYPELTLSLGWTTRWGSGLNGDKADQNEAHYSEENVANMIKAIKASGVTQPITYAVRAAFVAHSKEVLLSLLEKTKTAGSANPTLTVWSSDEKDVVEVPDLRSTIQAVGKERVYVDVGAELSKQLNSGVSAYASLTTILVALAAVLVSSSSS